MKGESVTPAAAAPVAMTPIATPNKPFVQHERDPAWGRRLIHLQVLQVDP